MVDDAVRRMVPLQQSARLRRRNPNLSARIFEHAECFGAAGNACRASRECDLGSVRARISKHPLTCGHPPRTVLGLEDDLAPSPTIVDDAFWLRRFDCDETLS